MPKEKKETKEKKVKSSGKGERFADMSTTGVIINEDELKKQLEQEVVSPQTEKKQKNRGKKYLKSRSLMDKNKLYSPQEAISLLKKISYAQFGGSVELHLNLTTKGNWEIKLPYFEQKAKKVAIFDEKVLEELKNGKINFDVLYATPADMPKILPFAKLLGPKGLLPNPQNGTLVSDPQKASQNIAVSAIRVKTEKEAPVVHLAIGKLAQKEEELLANLQTVISAINPQNIKKAFLKSTMSPSLKLSL